VMRVKKASQLFSRKEILTGEFIKLNYFHKYSYQSCTFTRLLKDSVKIFG
jgi:hypothetical protein